MLEFPLLADGVPPDKLYPLDIERAFKMFTKIKPYVTKWWVTGSTPPQLLSDKEVVLTSSYHGRIAKLIEDGAPVAIEWNQGLIVGQYWAIVKGTKNYKNAIKFIEFATQAENQANFVNRYSVSPVNKRAFDFVDPKKVDYIGTSPKNIKGQIFASIEWWAENRERVIERWNKWILEK